MKRTLSTQSGFTMLEMAIVVALFMVAGYVLFATTRAGNEQNNAREIRMTLQDNAREGLYKMVQEIRQSAPSRITIASSGGEIQFSVPDPSDLTNADYTVNWTSAHTIRYYLGGLNNSKLMRQDLTTNLQAVMASDITAVSFTGNAAQPTVVTITLSAQKVTPEGRTIPSTPLQLSAEAEVRNL